MYQLSWYLENRIISGKFQGIVTADEFNLINDTATTLVRQGQPPVHDIIDTLNLDKIPLDLKLIWHSMQIFREPNLGWVIVIARNPLFGFFGSTVSQLAGKRFRTVETWKDALATLARVDSTLAHLTQASHQP